LITRYTIERCPCGHPVCKDWHVLPVAAVQGVKFTHEQAAAVAYLLNQMAQAEASRLEDDRE
jgi:hypothetical protein